MNPYTQIRLHIKRNIETSKISFYGTCCIFLQDWHSISTIRSTHPVCPLYITSNLRKQYFKLPSLSLSFHVYLTFPNLLSNLFPLQLDVRTHEEFGINVEDKNARFFKSISNWISLSNCLIFNTLWSSLTHQTHTTYSLAVCL